MVKNVKNVFILFAFCLMIFIAGCEKTVNADKNVIPTPDKIILYYGGKSKEITEKDKEFKDIVTLMNSRIDKEELSIVKTEKDFSNEYIEGIKKDNIAVEFIYDNEQKIDIKNSNKTITGKYYKLFFKISYVNISYVSTENNIFHLGDKDKYNVFSVGPLKQSGELDMLVQKMFNE